MIRKLFGGARIKPTPIVEAPNRRGYDRDYRRPGDDRHIIRINQKAPKGYPKKLHDWVAVAGVSYRQAAVIEFINGHQRRITIEHEPDNTHSDTALKVVGHWLDSQHRAASGQLGYLPSEISAAITADLNDIGARIETMYAPHGGQAAGLRVSIWGKRKR